MCRGADWCERRCRVDTHERLNSGDGVQVGAAAAEEARAEHAATQGRLSQRSSSHGSQNNPLPHQARERDTTTAAAINSDNTSEQAKADGHAAEAVTGGRVLDGASDLKGTVDVARFAAADRATAPPRQSASIDLQVGVLHFSPTLVPFPLLADPKGYVADTYDLSNVEERDFWLNLLASNVSSVVEKAALSTGTRSAETDRRAQVRKAGLLHRAMHLTSLIHQCWLALASRGCQIHTSNQPCTMRLTSLTRQCWLPGGTALRCACTSSACQNNALKRPNQACRRSARRCACTSSASAPLPSCMAPWASARSSTCGRRACASSNLQTSIGALQSSFVCTLPLQEW